MDLSNPTSWNTVVVKKYNITNQQLLLRTMNMRSQIRKREKQGRAFETQKKADRVIYAIIIGLILLAIITVAFYCISM